MPNVVHVEPKDVQPLIAATFPAYRGQRVQVCPAETVTLYNLNWCGGSRNQYAACTLAGQPLGNASLGNAAPPWKNPVEGQTVPLPPGSCLVEACMFCGRDLGLRIYVHPSDMPRWLPAANTDLTDQERTVLKLIRSRIASFRREEARREGINAAQYEVLVETLKAKGLLTKQGGLTLAGKNAAASR